ncbi:PCYCGC motif-containing (lipo)protein [Sutcliffiella horikoshii]|uniref:PCYCGC motif-containing (lipo)protein n=1 Tax=Sutcliffiella horikoshii TaxID=79883 RepID=UPI003CF9262D
MKKLALVASCMLVLTVGCSNTETQNNAAQHSEEQHHHNEKPSFFQGDLREETDSVKELPAFLKDKPEDMQLIYSAAAQHKEVLEYIPCYCGCGTSAGHKSSYNCFVYENKEDGSLVWDDHGTRCGVCLEIAATSVMEYSKGKSVKEIRHMIDEAYKEGYSTPTPTPEPENG